MESDNMALGHTLRRTETHTHMHICIICIYIYISRYIGMNIYAYRSTCVRTHTRAHG